MIYSALLFSACVLLANANPYGGGPAYPQRYRPAQQYNNRPSGSGRPQQQGAYPQSNYEQYPSAQDNQYESDDYHYAQQPLYPEKPVYYTRNQTTYTTTGPVISTTTIDNSTTNGTTTVNSTTPIPATTIDVTTIATIESTTVVGGETTSIDPESSSLTADVVVPAGKASKKTSSLECPKIPSGKQVCTRGKESVPLAVDCSVVSLGEFGKTLRKPTGACPSTCSDKKNKIVEYTYAAVKNVPDFSTAIKTGAVSLIVNCPNKAKFCTCNAKTCCQIQGTDILSVSFLPHCTKKGCENVLFAAGTTGGLKCVDNNGKNAKTFIANNQLKNQTLDSSFLVRSMTSVSCNGCEAIKKKTCTK